MKRVILTICVVLGIAFAVLAPAAVLFSSPAPGAGLPKCSCGLACQCVECECNK
jgi:hypothetical protein